MWLKPIAYPMPGWIGRGSSDLTCQSDLFQKLCTTSRPPGFGCHARLDWARFIRCNMLKRFILEDVYNITCPWSQVQRKLVNMKSSRTMLHLGGEWCGGGAS